MEIGINLQNIYEEHINNMSIDVEQYANGESSLNFPIISDTILGEIMRFSIQIFSSEDIFLQLTEPLFIVGDIHGHILDLYRIFQKNGLPPDRKYLFLGDIVDRGKHSFECLTLILIMKILYPFHVYIIRGNHEFLMKHNDQSFYNEITEKYFRFDDVGNHIYQVFGYMPLAAKIGNILCIHGGLDPRCMYINEIQKLKRPIYLVQEPFEGIVWSDPKEDLDIDFIPSPRGQGFYFSEAAFNRFMENNNLQLVIRGHEFVNGIKESFNGRLITVFSASSYVVGYVNSSGLVFLQDQKPRFILYPQIPEPIERKLMKLKEQSKNTASMPKINIPVIKSPMIMPKRRKHRRSLLPSNSSSSLQCYTSPHL